MSLMRLTLSTAIKGNFTASLPPSLGSPITKAGALFSPRSFSTTLAGKRVCVCGAKLPSVETIIGLYKARTLKTITQMVSCKQLSSYDFNRKRNCELTTELDRISALMLTSFEDVVYLDNEPFVMLESLNDIPEGDLGDLTGDHGKQVSKFIKHCLEKRLITYIGSLIDVGGQNSSTVLRVTKALGYSTLPSIIVDLNSTTPAVSSSQPSIKYAIGDACNFFHSEKYQDCTKDIIDKKPTLVLFNNILNVLKAEDGWDTLKAAWSRLRSGDYLFISGLVPEQLEKYGMKRTHELDGIVEFHNRNTFYKSAILPNFSDFIEVNLKNSSVLVKETFSHTIETKRYSTTEVQGYRLFALRKKVIK